MRLLLPGIAVIVLASNIASAEDDARLKNLIQENELLQAQLEDANLKIEKLEKELAALRRKKTEDQKEAGSGPIAVNSQWVGQFTRVPNATEPRPFTTDGRLVITSVDGETFVAECWFNSDNDAVQVDGTIKKNGTITFKYTKVIAGDFPRNAIGSVFKGRLLRGSEIRTQFYTPGTNRAGTFNLSLKPSSKESTEGE